MTEGGRCSECGKELPGDRLEKICPDCLLQHGPGSPSISSRNRWQGVRHRLLGGGIGLLLTGLVSVTLGLTVHFLGWPGNNQLFSALATMSLASGPVILWGAFCLLRLEMQWLVRLSSWLAMLPCGFGWILGLPAGLWTLVALARPDVQAAFQRRQAEYDAEQDQILDEADADLRDS